MNVDKVFMALDSLFAKSTKPQWVKKIIIKNNFISILGYGYIAFLPMTPDKFMYDMPAVYGYKKDGKWNIIKARHHLFIMYVADFVADVLKNTFRKKLDLNKYPKGTYTVSHTIPIDKNGRWAWFIDP